MSTDTLADEHASLQRAVIDSRRHAFTAADTAFVRDMQKVMDDYRDARAGGMTKEQAIPGIEAVLRSVWGKRTTKFPPLCEVCEDTGWQEHSCWHEHRCGRDRCAEAHPGVEHAYVTNCSCLKGDARAGRRAVVVDDISEAMRPKRKRSGFQRFGG